MPKRKVIVETISEFVVTGPDLTKGWVKVYRDYPVEAPYTNPKNSGGEIWDWAQSNLPDHVPEEQEFEVGGGKIVGTLRWICVRGVLDAKGKKSLPIAETYHKKKPAKKKPAKQRSSPSTRGKRKTEIVKGPDKLTLVMETVKPKPAKSKADRDLDDLFEGKADFDDVKADKIEKALKEG